MAPSTPPPPSRDLLAAFTMTSTANVVMSACNARSRADMSMPPGRRPVANLLELTAVVPLRPTGSGELSSQIVEQRHIERLSPKIHGRCPFIARLMIAVREIVLAVRAAGRHPTVH